MLPSRLILLLSALSAGLAAVAVDLPGPFDRVAVALIASISVLVKSKPEEQKA